MKIPWERKSDISERGLPYGLAASISGLFGFIFLESDLGNHLLNGVWIAHGSMHQRVAFKKQKQGNAKLKAGPSYA